MSLSSPDHAVSLFRRQPFWEGFWVRSRGFAGRDIQTQPKVPTVYFEGNWRCKLHPKAAKPPFFYRFRAQRLTLKITPAQVSEVSPAAAQIVSFLAVPAATFDTEDHPSTGQKMGSFSPVPEAAFLGRLLGQKSWFCRS